MCSGTQQSDRVIRKAFKCRFPVNYDGAPKYAISWTPPMTPPRQRKRRLAARVANPDNVSWPALKQRRLAFQQQGETNGADVDDVNTRPSARSSTHLSYEHLLGAVKSSNGDTLSELSTLSSSEDDANDVVNDVVQKEGEKWKREGSVVVTETETPEEELGPFRSRIISSCES